MKLDRSSSFLGSVGLWVGIYNPFDDWLTCQNQDCNFRLNTIYGLNLDYYNMNNPITIKKQFRCIELNPNSSMSSQDCQKLLQPVCETDCSPKGDSITSIKWIPFSVNSKPK